MQFIPTGDHLNAKEARERGLVNRVVPSASST